MNDTSVSAMGSRKSVGLLTVLAVAVVTTTACKPNVEKLRDEQDSKMQQDKRAAIGAYKARYEAKPQDPVATYLYGRVAAEAKLQLDLATKLVNEHPDFAWGHLLLGARMRDRGELEAWKREVLRAAELDSGSETIKREAQRASQLLVLEAGDFESILTPMWMGDRAAPDKSFSDFDQLERLSRVKRGTAPGFEALAATQLADDRLMVLLFVKNTGSSRLTITSEWAGDKKGACYTDEGTTVKPTEWRYAAMHGQDNCLFCGSDVVVPQGKTAIPNAIFVQPGSPLTRCVFDGFPDTIVLVKIKRA